jgi:hypothetical protein
MSERGHQGRDGLKVLSINPVPRDYRSKGQKLINNGRTTYNRVRVMIVKKARNGVQLRAESVQ